MCYYQYLYRLNGIAVPIADMVKISILAADVLANQIIGTPQIRRCLNNCVITPGYIWVVTGSKSMGQQVI